MKNNKNEEKSPKTKSTIEFDPRLSCSIKNLAVKKNSGKTKEKQTNKETK